ncbi:MAG: hypothetical protein HN712_27290 [Gemmatimonadetes bacterium]|jgi:hypothetical protein|nr:hypothetical protein [Gemmatimonadota bacterium]MBT6145428.1 hypothetical protein [Gemmatimonadota bacterium]MBT7864047.1 hypothetical protein [Gemmatimonadota bacterium]
MVKWKSSRISCMWLVAMVAAATCSPATAFDFALIGDAPYSLEDSLRFGRLQERINAEDLEFVLHVGDIKGGSSSCADEALQRRHDWYDRFSAPFILVPGDNDWTDCHREGAGAWAPLDRLAALRRIFFTPPGRLQGGGQLKVMSQAQNPAYASYPEHLRWTKEGVWFVNLHIVGSHNGRRGFAARTAADDDEVEARTAAALVWMRQTFVEASAQDAPGIMVTIHANPQFDAQGDSLLTAAFGQFIEVLRDEVIRFGKPVVLAHGDSHYFRIDKPLTNVGGRRLDYFTRVESFGSPHMHWIRVQVDPRDPLVFRFRQEIIPENAIRR